MMIDLLAEYSIEHWPDWRTPWTDLCLPKLGQFGETEISGIREDS